MKRVMFLMAICFLTVGIVFAGGQGEKDEEVPFEERYQEMSWDEITEEARGQTVYWHMWGGNEAANEYVTGYIADRLQDEYGVTLEQVPVNGAQVFMNAVLGEKQAGKHSGGSVDVMWINGANFYKMKNENALFGPYTEMLPNIQYVAWEDPSISWDFGVPTEGFESPWYTTQVVVIYDEEKTPNYPKNIGDFLDWVVANPGRFTYPIIDDFTGQDFVKHVLYHVAGGPENLAGDFSQEKWEKYSPLLWDKLKEIDPHLWRGGDTYPESRAALETLFGNGEIDFMVAYGPTTPENLIDSGQFPESARTYVWDDGTIGGANYLAISYNSSAKAASMVLCDIVIDPAAQYEAAKPDVWGRLPINDMSKVSEDWQEKFEELPRGESVLSPAVLNAHMIPELHPEYVTRIIDGWKEHILGD